MDVLYNSVVTDMYTSKVSANTTEQISNISSTYSPISERQERVSPTCTSGIELMRLVCEVGLSLPIAIFGIIGNILAFTILQSQKHKQSTTIYLQALSIADILILISSVLLNSLRYIPICFGVFKVFLGAFNEILVVVFPCLYFFRFASTWLTVSLTFDRWIAVCYPLSAQRRCTLSRAYKQVVAIWVVSTLYSMPRFFEYELVDGHAEVTNLVKKNKAYTIAYRIICYFILMYLIPMAVIIFLNLRLLLALQKSEKLRENIATGSIKSRKNQSRSEHNSVTTVVLSVAIVFFTCNLLAMISQLVWSLHECFKEDLDYLQNYRRYMAHISNVLVTLNSAVNFLIYCAFSKSFRGKFIRMYCSCLPIKSQQAQHTPFCSRTSMTYSFTG